MTSVTKQNRGLKHILFVFAFIIIVVLVLLLGQRFYRFVFAEQIEIKQMEHTISATIGDIETLVVLAEDGLDDLSTIMEIHKPSNNENKILLQSLLFNVPEFSGAAICHEPTGTEQDSAYHSSILLQGETDLQFADVSDKPEDYIYKDWYLMPKILMKPVWSEPFYDNENDETLKSIYSAPFFYFNGVHRVFKGVAALQIDVDVFIKHSEKLGEQVKGDVLLISENGTILSAPHKEWIYNETIFSVASEFKLPIIREIGRRLQRGESGKELVENFRGGPDMMIYYRPIKANNWSFLLLIPLEEKLLCD